MIRIDQFMFTVPYSTDTTAVPTVVNSGGSIGWIVGVTVFVLLLAISIIVVLTVVIYIKRANNNRKRYNTHSLQIICGL